MADWRVQREVVEQKQGVARGLWVLNDAGMESGA